MKKILYFSFLLMLVSQGAWAKVDNFYPRLMNPAPIEGPWTFEAVNNSTRIPNRSGVQLRSFYDLDHSANDPIGHDDHPSIYQWRDGEGTGFTMCGKQTSGNMDCVFSTYYHIETLPPYTRKLLTWDFSLLIRTLYKKHIIYSEYCEGVVSMYTLPDLEALKNLRVYCYEDYDKEVRQGHLGYLYSDNDKKKESSEMTATFEFDNRNGNDTTLKAWYLLMTQTFRHQQDGDVKLHVWGSFKSKSETWATYYYKHITFDATGGVGAMNMQEIENSGNLTANAFIRTGYTFAGWATSADGPVVYADGAVITATEDSKGPVTLYAVWKLTPTTVVAAINAIGEVVYTSDCKAKIDAAREAYEALSETDKGAVTNYSTLTDAEAAYADVKTAADAADAAAAAIVAQVDEVIAQIEAIGEVTAESNTAISTARTAHNALTNAQKTQVTNYATLLAAEAAYADLGKTTFQFVNRDASETVISYRKAITYPNLPAGATLWHSVEKDATDKTIVIKAAICEPVTLLDGSNNATTIGNGHGHYANVTISGRTLYKDGDWNTLCLPFGLTSFAGTPLEGATVKTLVSTELSGSTLTLNFSEGNLTAIEAGKPYIVKWASSPNIVDPVFSGVTISSTPNNVETTYADFVGNYNPVVIASENRNILYVGSNNNLHYPNGEMTINAFRAYFQLKGSALTAAPSRIIMNLGEENTATYLISSPEQESDKAIKFYQDGHIYIRRGGITYDALGRIVK